jgi:hypothetical protein
LPAEIPIHKFHDFSSPVATATPFYEGDVLKARGVFDPDPEAQVIRSKIGRSIRYMSVGFMAATRSDQDGTPHITRAELLEASFVSVPSNREAAILAVKSSLADKQPIVNNVSISGPVPYSTTSMGAQQVTYSFDTSITKFPADTTPEEPAAADDSAGADPPVRVPVGQVYAAVIRAQTALLTT